MDSATPPADHLAPVPPDFRAAPAVLLLHAVVLSLAGFSLALAQHHHTMRGIVLREYFPAYLGGTIGDIFHSRLLMRLLLRGLWDNLGGSIYTINIILQGFAATIGLMATWLVARRFAGGTVALFASLGAAVALLPGFAAVTGRISYPYDLPAFAFSAMGLAAIFWGRFRLLVGVVLIGCLNKETVFWLVPCWFLVQLQARGWKDWHELLSGGCILGLAFCAAYLVPRLLLPAEGSGRMLTMSWIETDPGAPTPGQPRIWQNFRVLFLFKPEFAWPWIHLGVAWHAASLLFSPRWPSPLRMAAFASPFFLVPTLMLGNVWELRIFNELVPLTATGLVFVGASLAAPRAPLP